jgi:hypothetical protein
MKKKFDDGIHSISGNEYHSSQGYSRSALMDLVASPYHFHYEHLSGLAEKKEATDAMVLGSVFHTLLLEEHLFNDEYVIEPKFNKKTKVGKQLHAEFQASKGMKTAVKQDLYDTALSMKEAILKHPMILDLIMDAEYEQSIYWTDKETGLQFKARPDIWHPHMIVDLKTAVSGEYYDFQRAALNGGYFLQAGMMYEACKAIGKPFEKFVFLVAEKKEPFAPAVYPLDDWSLDFGVDQFNNAKKKLAMCLERNEWPSYTVQELRVPGYARDTLEYLPDFE